MDLTRVAPRKNKSEPALAAFLHKVLKDDDLNPNILHERYGHISFPYLQKMFPVLRNAHKLDLCDACTAMKPRKPYKKRYKTNDDGEIIYLCTNDHSKNMIHFCAQ